MQSIFKLFDIKTRLFQLLPDVVLGTTHCSGSRGGLDEGFIGGGGGRGGADFSPLFIKELICNNGEQLTQRLFFFWQFLSSVSAVNVNLCLWEKSESLVKFPN